MYTIVRRIFLGSEILQSMTFSRPVGFKFISKVDSPLYYALAVAPLLDQSQTPGVIFNAATSIVTQQPDKLKADPERLVRS